MNKSYNKPLNLFFFRVGAIYVHEKESDVPGHDSSSSLSDLFMEQNLYHTWIFINKFDPYVYYALSMLFKLILALCGIKLNFTNLSKFYMLFGYPQIISILHGKPAFRATS